MSDMLPTGKLPPALLQRLLSRLRFDDPRVIVGPGVGEDAAVIDFGNRYLIAKTDPVTFAVDEIGWYAVHVNANDIACMGGDPCWFLATALLPEGRADARMAEAIFTQISSACHTLGITLCGGHTEITHGLDRPILVGCMLGEVPAGGLVRTGGAEVGDAVLLTKGIALEGTALIAREKAGELEGDFDASFLERCRGFLHSPGISVVPDASIARCHAQLHAMHDPTEGGLATGLQELATAASVGLHIEAEHIPILTETAILCERYELDPLGLIASGALLATLAPEEVDGVIAALSQAGIMGRVIGRVMPADHGIRLTRGGREQSMPTFARDEIARLFDPQNDSSR